MASPWEDEALVIDDLTQVQTALEAVGVMFNRLSSRIDPSPRRLETERNCDHCPAFQPVQGKPSHDAVRTWVRGFWRAMRLAPADWIALASDKRLEPVMAPLVGFIDVGDEFELAEGINDWLDRARQISRARSYRSGRSHSSGPAEPPPHGRRITRSPVATTPAPADQAGNTSAAADRAESSTARRLRVIPSQRLH